ncbi:MAG: MobA/MobL family protein [Lachnospiraceae bacterium]|nr:MobA/MobL family protein [Lachnospiraceae bacterium]
MAGFFRMEVKVVSRISGRTDGSVGINSSLNASAYISGEQMKEYTHTVTEASAYISGEMIHTDNGSINPDYRAKKGVVKSWVMLPDNAPKEYLNPEKLWNDVEKIEKGKNATLYREWIVCFDRHLSEEERYEVAKEFSQTLVNEGMAVQVAIHSGKNGNDNEHFHIIAPTRGFNEDGTWQKYKTYPRGYALDDNGEKIPVLDKDGNQKYDRNGKAQWKREPIRYVNAWNDKKKGNVGRWRKTFADIENKYLPEEYKVSEKSYKRQGIDRIPGKHLGKTAYTVHNRLIQRIYKLNPEKREEFLNRIRKAVEADVWDEAEYECIKKELNTELNSISPYAPKKAYPKEDDTGYEYVSIKLMLAQLDYYKRKEKENTAEENVDILLKLMGKLADMENDILITASTGMTGVIRNRLLNLSYEDNREKLNKVEKKIKEIERTIKKRTVKRIHLR